MLCCVVFSMVISVMGFKYLELEVFTRDLME